MEKNNYSFGFMLTLNIGGVEVKPRKNKFSVMANTVEFKIQMAHAIFIELYLCFRIIVLKQYKLPTNLISQTSVVFYQSI